MAVIVLDIDGVLANFTNSYRRLLTRIEGVDRCPVDFSEPPVWNWEPVVGFSDDTVRRAWDYITLSTDFWFSLQAMEHVPWILKSLEKTNHTTYFLTDRPGVNSQRQTSAWLRLHGMNHPNVVLKPRGVGKGELLLKLGADVFLDDKSENIESALLAAPNCNSFLLKRKYNSRLHGVVQTANSLLDFVTNVPVNGYSGLMTGPDGIQEGIDAR